MTKDAIINELKQKGNFQNKEGMGKFGINTEKAFGISVKELRKLAKKYGKNHSPAFELWETGFHEARILASMVAEHSRMTEEKMDEWAIDFNSRDLCDQCCNNLFVYTPFALNKSKKWVHNDEEFIRRAGFVLMAVASVHYKDLSSSDFDNFFEIGI